MDIILSVIIPAYNCEATIDRCVQSVISNKTGVCEDMEVIIVNDGSKDNTLVHLRNLQNKYDCVKIVDKENGGVSSARNAGIDVSIGKYIYFIDSDDFIASNFLPQVIKHMEQYGEQCCRLCGKKDISLKCAEELDLYNVPECDSMDFTLPQNATTLLNKSYLKWNNYVFEMLFRAEIIRSKNIRFKETCTFAEDELFILNFYLYNPTISCVSSRHSAYYYVVNPESLGHSQARSSIHRKAVSLLRCALQMNEWRRTESVYKGFDDYLCLRSHWYCYCYFSMCLIRKLDDLKTIKDNYILSKLVGLLPIMNYHHESGYPGNAQNYILRWIINHKLMYMFFLNLVNRLFK